MSVFHFFADLVKKKAHFKRPGKLDKFPFCPDLIDARWKGKFPDMVIRVNRRRIKNPLLCGGELIEMKDSKDSYTVASFNSTIPTGEKSIAGTGQVDSDVLPVRQAYYLVRGCRGKGKKVKVCLVHGSFFETVEIRELIKNAFGQAVDAADRKRELSAAERAKIIALMSSQEIFSAVRHVDRASVKLRFRIMTEVESEGNILKSYDEILDNTLNLIVPLHGKSEAARRKETVRINAAAKSAKILRGQKPFTIKHPFNGYFWVLQEPIA